MSVYVSDFHAGGQWQVTHDDGFDGPHVGPVAPNTLAFARRTDNTVDPRTIVVTCPVCGSMSFTPVGGGAQPDLTQELFLRVLLRPGQACPCGNLPAGRPMLLVIAHLKNHADQQDYSGRWRLVAARFTP